jgi:hypothetical protein
VAGNCSPSGLVNHDSEAILHDVIK